VRVCVLRPEAAADPLAARVPIVSPRRRPSVVAIATATAAALVKCYDQAVSLGVAKFNKDDVVDLIKRAISLANADGFRTISSTNAQGFGIRLEPLSSFPFSFITTGTILNASFRQQPSRPLRLPNPACLMR
jgi:hypothetical protein